MEKNHYVYILKAISKNKYYIGYTINLKRRLKQHNRELKGGAKCTAGNKWEYFAIFTNLDNRILGLKLEWRLKHLTKKRNIIEKIKCALKWYKDYKFIIFLYINENLELIYKNIIIFNNINYINDIFEYL